MADCWDGVIKPELSQGDLLALVIVGTADSPLVPLKRGATRKGGGESWDKSPWTPNSNGIGHFLGRGRQIDVIILSQDCEIDKRGGRVPVLVAPVFPISALSTEADRINVLSRKRYPFLPLPSIEGVLEESYADLRCTTYIYRDLIDTADRKKSMTSQGVNDLVKQIIAFMTHIPFEKIVVPTQGGVDTD